MRRVLSMAAVFAVVLPIVACRTKTEADRVRTVVRAVQEAAEEKKILAIQERISRSYRDPQGYDYDGIKGLLGFYFFRHKTVGVAIPDIVVVVEGRNATATFQAILTAKGIDGEEASVILPDALGAYDFEVALAKEENDWRIVSAAWERVGEDGSDAGAAR